ncbi:MAG: AtpZ/AtpI family protein [Patescibacteria group bacterium]|jgi:F0F1-type ATP synthase assembly protein I
MEKKKLDKNYWVEPVKIFTRLSAWIAFPVVFGALLGKWLDRRYDSSPRWFLIVIGLSFVISITGLIKNTLEETKKITKRQ